MLPSAGELMDQRWVDSMETNMSRRGDDAFSDLMASLHTTGPIRKKRQVDDDDVDMENSQRRRFGSDW